MIARCPEHGLHGERDTCFDCGGPVEQVPMAEVEHVGGYVVESDAICVLVWKMEDHPVGYGADKLDEVYGPFGSWDEAHAFARGLQLPAGLHSTTQTLRLPKLSPHGVQPEDFRG